MNQSFNSSQLSNLCRQQEYIHYSTSRENLQSELERKYRQIIDESFEFDIKKSGSYYFTENLTDKLILRKLNDNIKRIYKDEQANRKIIVSQIITLLAETYPHYVIKTDISSFFESINRERILMKFKNDSMLSYQTMFLLNKIFSNPTLSSVTGVPRGMNISSSLSEIYMRKFDRWVRRCDGVYYYARFVDDIIIFSHSLASALELMKEMDIQLEQLATGLQINKKKTKLYDGKTLKLLESKEGKPASSNIDLEYLGYQFRKVDENTRIPLQQRFTRVKDLEYTLNGTHTVSADELQNVKFFSINERPKAVLKVTVADKKIKKVKTRIIKALLDYGNNQSFPLLLNRIKFLTGNYSIKKTFEGNDLRAGIYYNYINVNDLQVFADLNLFFRKSIYSNGIFGRKVRLTSGQKRQLDKFCFISGFKNKVYHPFSFTEMEEIIECW